MFQTLAAGIHAPRLKISLIFLNFLIFSFFSSCSFFNLKSNLQESKTEPKTLQMTLKKTLKIKAFWAQDTLKSPNLGFRKVNRFTPVLYKDLIIAANSLEGLSAYDLYTKSLKWTIPVNLGIEASSALINSRLFVGGLNGYFYAIDLDSAEILWQFNTHSEITAEPLIVDGLVYFLSGANLLYCLDAVNGRQVWVYNRQDTSTTMTVRGGGRPAFAFKDTTSDTGLIFQGFSDGSLVALDAKTGSPQWEVLLNRNTKFKDLDASPIVDNDEIFVNSYDDKLYALSKSSGRILWKSEFGGSSTPLSFSDRLIYTTSRGQLIAVSKKSGETLWKIENLNGIGSDPILHKGLVVLGESQGKLRVFDALTGKVEGHFDPGRGILSRPISDKKNRIYFISGEANLYGLELEFEKDNSNFSFIN